MDYSKIIRIEPGKRSGKPNIRGTRMTVTDVLEYLASGMTEDQILADFPDLTSEDIKACLAFAADRERKLAALPEHRIFSNEAYWWEFRRSSSGYELGTVPWQGPKAY